MVKYLLESRSVDDLNAKNSNGYTALDILPAHGRRDVQDWDIGKYLREAGALKAAEIAPIGDDSTDNASSAAKGRNPKMPSFLRYLADSSPNDLNQGQWLAKKRDALMVVASLLATMAFQAGVSPPGGVWQDTKEGEYRAGEAVVAYAYPDSDKYYLRANTIGFVASLSTILFLISGLPFKRSTFMWMLIVIMWLSISAMAFTYSYAIVAVTPIKDRGTLRRTMFVAVPVWCGVMALLLLGHTIRLVGEEASKNNLQIQLGKTMIIATMMFKLR